MSVILTMAEINIDVFKLPEDVRDKLAELDLELSEGRRMFLWKDQGVIIIFSDKYKWY